MTPDRNRLQKYFADLKRVCEMEDTVVEWFDKEVYKQICMNSMKAHIVRQIDDFLQQLSQQFQIVFVEVGGIDFSVWKIHLKALSSPAVNDKVVFYHDLNISFRVVPKDLISRPGDSDFDSFVVADGESDDMLSITRNVKQKKLILVNEVKKLGVLIDRG